jgi:drebrin-like protein
VRSAATPRSPAAPLPVFSSNVPVKPAEEDRIEPAQSAYSPVSLPAPKKLKNPFAAMEQQSQQTFSPSTPSPTGGAKRLTWSERQALAKKREEEEEQRSQQRFSPSTSSPSGGAKKLTWSERQALAKKRAEEEEAESRSASTVPSVSPISKPVFKSSAPTFGRAVPPSAPRNFGAVGAAAGVGAVAGATAAFSARSTPPAPVAAPISYTSARDAVQDAAWGTEEDAQTAVAEAELEPEAQYQFEPEVAPEPQYQAVSIFFAVNSSAE